MDRHVTPGVRVDGGPVEAREPGTLDSLNPATGRVAGTAASGGPADARWAVDAADRAFASWSAADRAERARALRAIADWLGGTPDGLARLISVETGKRLAESRAELGLSARFFAWFAEAAERPDDEEIHAVPGVTHRVHTRPLGVVAAVTPWNFPVSIPARKIAAALAAGCPVVFKPSEVAPLSGLAFAEGVERRVPAGVINTVTGDGADITNAWLDDPRVRGLTFTGSTRVGTRIAARAAPTLTRLVLELGGDAPFVVLDDADLDAALETLLIAKYRNNGQSCIAASQVWLPERVREEFVGRLADASAKLRLGDPLDESTDLGPMALASDPGRLAELADDAAASGADVHTAPVAVPERGFFAPPRICVGPGPGARVVREEPFGPITVVHPYREVDEAIAAVRRSALGLGGYVCGRDTRRAERVAAALDVGIVGVNQGAPNTPQVPFGGLKLSGVGVEGALAGMREFLAYQTIAINDGC